MDVNGDLVISKELLESIGMSDKEMRIEMAIMLYKQQRWTMDESRRFSKLGKVAFQNALVERAVEIKN